MTEKRKILWVDDDHYELIGFVEHLEVEGFEVSTARTVKEAKDAIQKSPPDLELMGHTDIRTSLRYVHPVTERKRTAVESVIRAGKNGRQDEVCHKSATEEERPAARLALSS